MQDDRHQQGFTEQIFNSYIKLLQRSFKNLETRKERIEEFFAYNRATYIGVGVRRFANCFRIIWRRSS